MKLLEIIFIVTAIAILSIASGLSLQADDGSETEDNNSTGTRCANVCSYDYSPVCAMLVSNLSMLEYSNYCNFEAAKCEKPLELGKTFKLFF